MKKNGFTLIELLAVIIVLSVIALISVPIVGNTIEEGRKSAIKSSSKLYLNEIEKKYAEWIIEGYPDDLNPTIETSSTTKYDVFNVVDLNSFLDLDGTLPNCGTIKIDSDYANESLTFGYAVDYDLKYEGKYIVKPENGKLELKKDTENAVCESLN